MNEVEQLAPGDIWDKVSDDAKKLAISLFHSQGFSQARDYIEDMAQDKDGGFDLEQGMQGLSDFGVLQEITLIEEKKKD